MKLTLKIWRQENATVKGSLHTYSLDGVSPDMSFFRNDGCVERTTHGTRY
jgi:hypothetical protein